MTKNKQSKRPAHEGLSPEQQKELFLLGGFIEPSCKHCGNLVTEARGICRACWGDDL